MISEISGGQGQNKNLTSRMNGLDEQVVRQQELLYNVEFQLQQMERKVSRPTCVCACVCARVRACVRASNFVHKQRDSATVCMCVLHAI